MSDKKVCTAHDLYTFYSSWSKDKRCMRFGQYFHNYCLSLNGIHDTTLFYMEDNTKALVHINENYVSF